MIARAHAASKGKIIEVARVRGETPCVRRNVNVVRVQNLAKIR